jgi:membrane fusion protein
LFGRTRIGPPGLLAAIAAHPPPLAVTELFRRQAIDHQRQKFHGAIVLTRNPWQFATTVFLVAIVGALLAFAATNGFARRESVPGLLAPTAGVLRLVAPQAGIVLPGGLPQGRRVTAGETVLRLSQEQASASGPTQAAIVESIERRRESLRQETGQLQAQARERDAALAARIASLDGGLAQQSREIGLQRERVRLVREVADRYPDLVKSGAVSPVEAAERADDLLSQQARLAELERAQHAMEGDLAQARAERAALPISSERETAQLKREMDALAQSQAETEARRETLVQAPQAGEIAAQLVEAGQPVAAGQTLATLLPAGSVLEAELLVPSRAAGRLAAGLPVWLRVDAFPFARFGQIPGHVRDVSRSAVPADDAAGGSTASLLIPGAVSENTSTAGAYRVHVTLDDPTAADPTAPWRRDLRPGMHVQASLVAERRTLLQWAFEPLEAMRVAAK